MGRRWRATATMAPQDRKSTRLNSSHLVTSYAVFCLKKKIAALMDVLDKLEGSLIVLERRGVTLSHIIAQAQDGKLPTWHFKVGGKDQWLTTPAAVDA